MGYLPSLHLVPVIGISQHLVLAIGKRKYAVKYFSFQAAGTMEALSEASQKLNQLHDAGKIKLGNVNPFQHMYPYAPGGMQQIKWGFVSDSITLDQIRELVESCGVSKVELTETDITDPSPDSPEDTSKPAD